MKLRHVFLNIFYFKCMRVVLYSTRLNNTTFCLLFPFTVSRVCRVSNRPIFPCRHVCYPSLLARMSLSNIIATFVTVGSVKVLTILCILISYF